MGYVGRDHKKRTVFVDVNGIRWRSAPVFKRRDLAILDDPAKRRQIYAFYQQPQDRTAFASKKEQAASTTMLSPTGREDVSRTNGGALVLAGGLIGEKVVNEKEKRSGEFPIWCWIRVVTGRHSLCSRLGGS